MRCGELFAEYERLKSENTQLREQLTKTQQRAQDAQLLIAHLRRELFCHQADRLAPEQEEQLRQLNQALEDEAACGSGQRPNPGE
jgi:chromosome segregation ATPase